MGRLDNKVAVITGAASGMGRATAIRFAGEGAAVVIADLNQEGGKAAVRECRENGGRAVFQKTDVSAEGEIKAAIDRALDEFGRLDITFNNAGLGGALGPIDQISVESWDRTFAILLRSVFLGINIQSRRCAKRAADRSSRPRRSPESSARPDRWFTASPKPA
jgi:NAD(P)-dependent dehydrogenase (short-subunit alcohol dehydrogenase family)